MSCGCYPPKETTCNPIPSRSSYGAFLEVTNKLEITQEGNQYIKPEDFDIKTIIVYNVNVADLGSPYSHSLILPKLPENYKANVKFAFTFPLFFGITITVKQFLSGNPDSLTFKTDGIGVNALAELSFNGQVWSVTNGIWIE